MSWSEKRNKITEAHVSVTTNSNTMNKSQVSEYVYQDSNHSTYKFKSLISAESTFHVQSDW